MSPVPSPRRRRLILAALVTASAATAPAAASAADLTAPDPAPATASSGFVKAAAKGPSQATLAAAIGTVAYEQVYGSNYRILKARFPKANYPSGKGIIWANNACSVPRAAAELEVGLGPWLRGKPVAYYAGLFVKSCDRHDFGYRNYGTDAGGRALDPTESRRLTIDARFGANMDYQCKRIFSRKYVEAIQRGACYKASDLFRTAVNKRGQDAFFR